MGFFETHIFFLSCTIISCTVSRATGGRTCGSKNHTFSASSALFTTEQDRECARTTRSLFVADYLPKNRIAYHLCLFHAIYICTQWFTFKRRDNRS